jgi:hypothetical protein
MDFVKIKWRKVGIKPLRGSHRRRKFTLNSGGAKSTMGIRIFDLRVRQVRTSGKIGLSQFLIHIHMGGLNQFWIHIHKSGLKQSWIHIHKFGLKQSWIHLNPFRHSTQIYLPFFTSVTKWKLFLGRKSSKGGGAIFTHPAPPLPPATPGENSGTYLCKRMSRPKCHTAAGRINSMKKSQWTYQESNPRPFFVFTVR